MSMMSCRQVRKRLVDLIDGALASESRDRIEEHLRQCVSCSAERDVTIRIASTLAAAGAVASGPAVTGTGFEQRVLATARARSVDAAPTHGILVEFRAQRWPAFPAIRRPAPLQAAAAAAIMVLAGVIAVMYGGLAPFRDASPSMAARESEPAAWDYERDYELDHEMAGDLDRLAAYDADAMEADRRDLDVLMPEREVPFSLRQDLVGVRSGRIPATTYVLEPAPDESAVMRASF